LRDLGPWPTEHWDRPAVELAQPSTRDMKSGTYLDTVLLGQRAGWSA
jgi:hypothetical protein